MAALTTAQVAALTTEDLNALGTTQFAALTSGQISHLTTAQVVALETVDLHAISTSALQAMTTEQIVAITTDHFQALSTNQIAALTTAQAASLTTDQIVALTTDQIVRAANRRHRRADDDPHGGVPNRRHRCDDGDAGRRLPARHADRARPGRQRRQHPAAAHGVNFDLNATGTDAQVGWASATDGLLVMDRNRDGKINDGRELFGVAAQRADGTRAGNGYAACSRKLPARGQYVRSPGPADHRGHPARVQAVVKRAEDLVRRRPERRAGWGLKGIRLTLARMP